MVITDDVEQQTGEFEALNIPAWADEARRVLNDGKLSENEKQNRISTLLETNGSTELMADFFKLCYGNNSFDTPLDSLTLDQWVQVLDGIGQNESWLADQLQDQKSHQLRKQYNNKLRDMIDLDLNDEQYEFLTGAWLVQANFSIKQSLVDVLDTVNGISETALFDRFDRFEDILHGELRANNINKPHPYTEFQSAGWVGLTMQAVDVLKKSNSSQASNIIAFLVQLKSSDDRAIQKAAPAILDRIFEDDLLDPQQESKKLYSILEQWHKNGIGNHDQAVAQTLQSVVSGESPQGLTLLNADQKERVVDDKKLYLKHNLLDGDNPTAAINEMAQTNRFDEEQIIEDALGFNNSLKQDHMTMGSRLYKLLRKADYHDRSDGDNWSVDPYDYEPVNTVATAGADEIDDKFNYLHNNDRRRQVKSLAKTARVISGRTFVLSDDRTAGLYKKIADRMSQNNSKSGPFANPPFTFIQNLLLDNSGNIDQALDTLTDIFENSNYPDNKIFGGAQAQRLLISAQENDVSADRWVKIAKFINKFSDQTGFESVAHMIITGVDNRLDDKRRSEEIDNFAAQHYNLDIGIHPEVAKTILNDVDRQYDDNEINDQEYRKRILYTALLTGEADSIYDEIEDQVWEKITDSNDELQSIGGCIFELRHLESKMVDDGFGGVKVKGFSVDQICEKIEEITKQIVKAGKENGYDSKIYKQALGKLWDVVRKAGPATKSQSIRTVSATVNNKDSEYIAEIMHSYTPFNADSADHFLKKVKEDASIDADKIMTKFNVMAL